MSAEITRVQVTPGSARVVRVDEECYSIRLRKSGPAPMAQEHSQWMESLNYAIEAEDYLRSQSLGITTNGFDYAAALDAVCSTINFTGFVDIDPARWIKVNQADFNAQN